MGTNASALATALQAQKLLGRSPAGAIATLAGLPVALTGLHQAQLGAAALGAMLNNVYAGKISPLDTAVILCDMGYCLADVAAALSQACPALTALDTAAILLDRQVYPRTTRTDMVAALDGAGYHVGAVALAATLLFPLTVAVQARNGWQATGATIDGKHMTTIACQGGNWTIDLAPGGCDGGGYPALVAGPACPLPGAPRGALVGRIGTSKFLVGNVTTVPAGLAGPLELGINNDAMTPDGAGPAGRGGRLLVRVSVKIPVRSST
jgi:hypothetical protein